MAFQTQRYTVFGFSQELDWRPLYFAEPVPAHRICDGCGLLPRVTVFLPCRHVLCKTCYEQCVVDDQHSCPLDGDAFLDEDVQWGDFPLENLLKRKVHCWNKEYGCESVVAASEICKHFHQDCDHHSTCCPRCAAVVRRRSVRAHLRSNCQDYVAFNKGAGPETTRCNDQQAILLALKATVEERVGEMKERLDSLSCENRVQIDRTNELHHCINTLKEMLPQPSENTTSQDATPQSTNDMPTIQGDNNNLVAEADVPFNRSQLVEEMSTLNEALNKAMNAEAQKTSEMLQKNERVMNNLHEQLKLQLSSDLKSISCSVSRLSETFGKELDRAIKRIGENMTTYEARVAAMKECDKKVTDQQLKLLAFGTKNLKRYTFFINGVKSLKRLALEDGSQTYYADRIYLSGYCMSPAIYIKKSGNSVQLYTCIQLHKGVIDEFLPWPFHKSTRLSVTNESTDKQCQLVNTPCQGLEYFGRPATSSNRTAYFPDSSLLLEDLERDGYVVNDKLHITWELLHPRP
ncbi:TNF receptor-associated factor 6-B-like isoform X3 [Dermacentor silvarum]|uniref:TNF receptor-associated factor 6-B-like isoform X3 n=1 Tax=Dermacentor silvarum TaxID=543639 RepID=UPI001899A718|nr:TNF receptor-associated factor 6-B-like isoform X3 [Dermacentor silvarum]